jgi:hypothetical protein
MMSNMNRGYGRDDLAELTQMNRNRDIAADTSAAPRPRAIILNHALIARWLCGKIRCVRSCAHDTF